MKIYEFCGYLNTPDECAGKWYDDFPYPLDGTKIIPRTTYQDVARGCRMSENFQAFIITTDLITKDQWVGEWPEGADMFVTCPIQKWTFIERTIPTLEAHGGNIVFLHEGMGKLFVESHVEFVDEFVTKEGLVIKTTWRQK